MDICPIQVCYSKIWLFINHNKKFCDFRSQLFLKNMLKTQCLIIYDAIILVRYIFIFWLKNPMAVNDDFWSSFLNVWIVGASAIVNYVHGFLPGLKYFVRTFDTASFSVFSMGHQRPLFRFFVFSIQLTVNKCSV